MTCMLNALQMFSNSNSYIHIYTYIYIYIYILAHLPSYNRLLLPSILVISPFKKLFYSPYKVRWVTRISYTIPCPSSRYYIDEGRLYNRHRHLPSPVLQVNRFCSASIDLLRNRGSICCLYLRSLRIVDHKIG